MFLFPLRIPNPPPEPPPFESRYTKARARALGDSTPRGLLASDQAERQRPPNATDLQRMLDQRERRPASTWEGFPSYGAGIGALLALALILLYVVTR